MTKFSQIATNNAPAKTDYLLGVTAAGVDFRSLLTDLMKLQYPVGSLYFNASDGTNPGTLLGFGTWSAYSVGQNIVGIKASDPDFATAGQTGGQKDVQTHSHGVNDPGHRHPVWTVDQEANSYPLGGPSNRVMLKGGSPDSGSGTTGISGTGISIQNTGGGGSNMNPYIVAYVWQRTA